MSAPRTAEQTTQLLSDSLALTKVADGCGVAESTARSVAAGFGALPAEQILRICASARERQLRDEAAIRRHNAKRRAR